MDQFNTTEVLKIDRADGTPFAEFSVKYFGLGQSAMIELEEERLNAMAAWLEKAKARAG